MNPLPLRATNLREAPMPITFMTIQSNPQVPQRRRYLHRLRRFVERLLPQGRFARNVSVLAGGTALSQALAVLAAPLLTRLYRAEDFGYFQVYLSFMAFAMLAVTLRYEQAIFLPDQEEIAANLVGVTLLAVVAVSALSGAAFWLAQQYHFLPAAAAGLRPRRAAEHDHLPVPLLDLLAVRRLARGGRVQGARGLRHRGVGARRAAAGRMARADLR